MPTKLTDAPNRHGKRAHTAPRYLIYIFSALFLLLAGASVALTLIFPRTHVEEPPASTPEITPEPEPTPTETPYILFQGEPVEILEEVPVNDYSEDCFMRLEDGRMAYTGGWSAQGIDVSTFQGPIDWEQVRDDGVEFVMIRAAYRGYGMKDGVYTDEDFHTYIEGALDAGLDVGAYIFSQATNVREAEEEAEYLMDLVSEYPITYPLVFDWERISVEGSRTAELGTDVMSACALAFCRTVEDAGYTPSVYVNLTEGYLGFDLSAFSDYDLWLAQYEQFPDFYYNFRLWQYTCEGTVPGIEGTVDRDICFFEYSGKKD